MSKQLTQDDFKESLNGHVAAKGAYIHASYGPRIGWKELQQILLDRAAVRYPCEIVFDASALRDGECAHAAPNGGDPLDGFKIHVHPFFSLQVERVPWLVLYQLVQVNYGPFASAEDAETFGAAALGLDKDEYYAALCGMADELDPCGPA